MNIHITVRYYLCIHKAIYYKGKSCLFIVSTKLLILPIIFKVIIVISVIQFVCFFTIHCTDSLQFLKCVSKLMHSCFIK